MINSIIYRFISLFDKLSWRISFLISFFLSIFFCISFFGKFIFGFGKYTLTTGGDDLKNYFTLKSYITQGNFDITHYEYMNYPFGETIFFTDNTPVIAIALKLLHNLLGIESIYLNYIFELMMILGIILSTVLVFQILKKLIHHKIIIIVASVSLPFINPQFTRFFLGTENLSLSFLLLLVIYLSLLLNELIENNKRYRSAIIAGVLIMFMIFSSFIHLYYLLIFLAFIVPLYLIWIIKDYQNKKKLIGLVYYAVVTILPLILVAVILTKTDPYFELRKSSANGFGWEPWKLNISNLFTSYSWSYAKFIIHSNKSSNYESFAYLGPIALYGSLIFLFFKLSTNEKINSLTFSKSSILLIASVPSLFFSLGNEYHFLNSEYTFNNYLSISYYLNHYTDILTHFRCLGRFSWYFFWMLNIFILYQFDKFITLKKSFFTISFLFLSYITFQDVLHTGYCIRETIVLNDFHSDNTPEDIKLIKDVIKSEKYDAIIFLPFFQTGSEDYIKTLDPTSFIQKQCMLISDNLNLPMFSFMMSRTPLIFNETQLVFYNTAVPYKTLLEKSKNRRILVIRNQNFRNQLDLSKSSDYIKSTLENAMSIPEKRELSFVKKINNYELFEWNL